MGASKSQESAEPKKVQVDLAQFNVFVKYVNITGLNRTKDDYLQNSVDRLFEVKNFENLLEELKNTRNYLQDLRVFKDVKIKLDTNKSNNATQYDYDATFDCQELRRITGKIGTQIGQNEGAVKAELVFPNIWGRGENISLNGSYSNSKSNEIYVKFSKPFFHHVNYGLFRPEFSLNIFKRVKPRPESNYNLFINGVVGELIWQTTNINHSLQYEMSIREIKGLNKRGIPLLVREHFGPRLASRFRYVATSDKRDSNVFPTHGTYIKTINEANVLSGDINYWKTTNHIEYNYPILKNIVLQMICRAGIIQAGQKKNDKPIPISSLFILGGPLSIRGFQHGGINNHIEGCLIGSTVFWSGGLHLWAPLPFNSYFHNFGNHFRTHLFWNFGNTSLTTENMRSSLGIGIAFGLQDIARLEFNYCYPVLKQNNDHFVKTFQFGIGYEFL